MYFAGHARIGLEMVAISMAQIMVMASDRLEMGDRETLFTSANVLEVLCLCVFVHVEGARSQQRIALHIHPNRAMYKKILSAAVDNERALSL